MNLQSRRIFIKKNVKATLYIGLLYPFRQLFAFSKDESKLPSWTELVEYARWCPNVHNLQPHKLKIISETEAELYYDPTRLLPVGDPNAIFVTVAMGIFVEHLSIAASPYGNKVIITEVLDSITTSAKTNTLFAKLKILSTTDKEEINRELILKRRTSRLHFNGEELEKDTLYKIKKQAEFFENEFFSSSDKDFVDFVVDLNQQTLFEDLESKADRDELNNLFRYTEEEAKTKKDGLWSKCMGFSGSLMKSVFVHHEKWEKGLRKKILKGYYKSSFKGTKTICWLGGKFENTNDWLQCGRMLARNWLLLTQAGAYLHPFGSLITNPSAYKKINEKFTQPSKNKKIWMVFRAGYSAEPTRSYRLSTEEIIIK
ncbi:MAG: hypothetical protein ACKO6J_00520 [Crocinitomicaceae bacterium]